MRRLLLTVSYHTVSAESDAALRLARLRHRGYQITVYTPDMPQIDARFRAAGIDMRHLSLHGLTDVWSIRQLRNHLRHEAAGACLLVQSYASAFIALCARKLAHRSDLKVVMLDRGQTPIPTTRLARRVYRNLSAIIFTSGYALNLFQQAAAKCGHPLTPEANLHVIPEGVGPAPEPAPEPKGPFMALYNGQLRAGCGLEGLIDAMPRLRGKRTRLMIAGRGDSEYMDRLRRHAIRREVMDLISWRNERPDTADLAAQCHFGVFPYTSPDLFSDANVSVMAAGRPQIILPGPVAEEYLGNNGGALYVSGDNIGERVADAMLSLGQDPELRTRLGNEAADRYARTLTPEITDSALEKILEFI